MMKLPKAVMFRSSSPIDETTDTKEVLGHHMQFEIHDAFVNVVILFEIPFEGEGSDRDLYTNEEELCVIKLADASIHSPFEDDDAYFAFQARYDLLVREVEEFIATMCQPTFKELVTSVKPPEHDSPLTLDQLGQQDTINLGIKTIDGRVSVIRYDNTSTWPASVQVHSRFTYGVKLSMDANYPVYLGSQVQMIDRYGDAPKVLVNGTVYRCRLCNKEFTTEREHQAFLKIMAAGVKDLRVPAFKGYVKHESSSNCLGLIIENIEMKYANLHEAILMGRSILQDDIQSNLPDVERRQKWMSQIAETVKQLHEHDIVWGNVCPASVFIDMGDDAWLTDFRGFATMPWKTWRDGDDKESDLRAMNLLLEYVRTGEEPALPEQLQGVSDFCYNVEGSGDDSDEISMNA